MSLWAGYPSSYLSDHSRPARSKSIGRRHTLHFSVSWFRTLILSHVSGSMSLSSCLCPESSRRLYTHFWPLGGAFPGYSANHTPVAQTCSRVSYNFDSTSIDSEAQSRLLWSSQVPFAYKSSSVLEPAALVIEIIVMGYKSNTSVGLLFSSPSRFLHTLPSRCSQTPP